MNLQLIRHQDGYRDDGILSSLLQDDDAPLAVTLEHAYDRDDAQVATSASAYPEPQYIPKITPGTFTCVRGKHRLHGMTDDFETFEITGVTGHAKLLFHWGNYNDNSDGCVLTGDAEVVGEHNGKHVDMVTNSRVAFGRFMTLQAGVDSFTLTVSA